MINGHTIGLLTLDRHQRLEALLGSSLYVYVNEVNVTVRCVAADDRQGWALCYLHNADGVTYVDWESDPLRPAMEVLYGTVHFEIENTVRTHG